MSDGLQSSTVSQLAALVTRQKQALSEAGREDLAKDLVAVVTDAGAVSLRSMPWTGGLTPPEMYKAMELDPHFSAQPREVPPSR